MKQITEDYVSYEIAKLLKEKGFDELSTVFYNEDGTDLIELYDYEPLRNSEISGYAKVTQSLALKWLREVYNIHIEIRYVPDNFTDEPCYKAMIWDMNTEIGTPLSPNISYTYFETCVEAALKYTLENLI